jgi:hypothetical protein
MFSIAAIRADLERASSPIGSISPLILLSDLLDPADWTRIAARNLLLGWGA